MKNQYLWLVFFLIVFVNGFEAGGYQASLLNIGETYELSTASKGIFASVELFATMLAPIILGAWADKNNKLKCLTKLLAIQVLAAILIAIFTSQKVFIGGVFFLGLTTSALQFITIAALTDYYPVSCKKKIGFLTSMYALGAFVAPLVVSAYLKAGLSWRTLFMLLTATSAIAILGLILNKDSNPEPLIGDENEVSSTGPFVLLGILMLCVVMCIYVGFENGYAFFVDTLFSEELNSSIGKYALSIFWIVMIPSRILVGYLSKHAYKLLVTAIVAIPVITIIISQLTTDVPMLILCIPLGFACGAIYPNVLNIAMPLAGEHKATATGMITTATGIGGVVFTALTGILGQQFGLRNAMVALSSFFVLSLIAVLVLKFKGMGTK
ncbi:MFS transporter [Pseudobutyrivibrio sp. YE44]|uniref:MFS transporter n=1 Tax=Pseudobutyrivibrio sp. YE44 TaxID=1520802 RepID=UPI00159F8BE1|nr:MFS transporter [Pseudobutyrivibrio sp. YE44]